MNESFTGNPHRNFILLLFVVVMAATEPRAPNRSKQTFGVETANALLAKISVSHREKYRDQKLSQTHFNLSEVENWKRSVVALGRHKPGTGDLDWSPLRTGFAVPSTHGRDVGTLVVSSQIESFTHIPDRIRIHCYPFLIPPATHAHPAFLLRTGSMSLVRSSSVIGTAQAQISRWKDAEFEKHFPVVLIGIHEGALLNFFTHSEGKADSEGRIKIASRPPNWLGDFTGAPVFNTDGLVVGVYSPLDHRPTYVPSTFLNAQLQ